MDAPRTPHPSDPALRSYGLGTLDDGSARSIEAHLESCSDCRGRLAGITSDTFLGRLRDAQKSPGRTETADPPLDGTLGMAGAKARSGSPPAESLPPGLADHPDYEIRRELGRGGMGVVYLAHNSMMGRDEVLKVIGRHILERPGVLERFTREIRAVAKLRHPNIVTAYTAFRLDGGLVFAMEHVEGLDLSRLVKAKGPLPVAHAAYFAHQAALGLQHAHERGMVHRDIKPHNLMLTHDGRARVVKVLDFGLAKATREEKVDGGLTSQGQAMGTPDYIAPEQILDAAAADIRADLYSLGATLFYLLTGRPPFQASSLYDLYQAHISRDADPLNLIRPEVPAELAALVAKLMAKDPARRFQEPAEAAEALKFFVKSRSANTVAHLSRTGPSEMGPPARAEGSAPTEPATDAANRPIRPAKSPEATETSWRGLIDLREDDPARDAPLAVASRRRPLRARIAASVLALLGVLLVARMAGVLKVRTADGVIVLEDVPKDAEVSVDGEKIRLTRSSLDGPVEIQAVPGDRRVEVKKSGFKTFGEVVTVELGGSERITIRLEPIAASPPAPAPRPDVIAGGPPAIPPPGPRAPVDSIGMKLRLVPAGEFLMGASDDPGKEHRYAERAGLASPRHRVRITRPFYLGACEVSQEEYTGVTGSNPSAVRGDPRLPVESVSWFDAVAFCNGLARREGLAPYYLVDGEKVSVLGGDGYRLPTEAEWEYAARGGTQGLYAHGADGASIEAYSWVRSNSEMRTHPVGEKRPNGFGFHDMGGNVAEWCWDWLAPYSDAGGVAGDPTGPASGTHHVLRGGHIFNGTLLYCSPWDRAWEQDSNSRERTVGFRVARDVSPAATVLAGESLRVGDEDSRGRERVPGTREPLGTAARESPGPSLIPPAGPARDALVISGDSWRVEGDEIIKEGVGYGRLLFGDPGWRDYDLSFEARKTAGPNGFGGTVRAGREGSYFFAFGGFNDTRHYLARWSVPDQRGYDILSIPGAVGPLEWHKVGISLRGPNIRMVLDGQVLFAGRDNVNQEGCVGLRTYEAAGRFRNIKVTAPDGTVLWKGPPNLPSRVATLNAALDRQIPLHYPGGTPLSVLIADLRKATKGPSGPGIQIHVDPFSLQEAEKSMDSRIRIDFDNQPLSLALGEALRPLGLGYSIREGVLIIGGPGPAQVADARPVGVLSDGGPASRAVVAALESPVLMRYSAGTSIRYVVQTLKDYVRRADGSLVPFHVDPAGLHEAEKSMDSKIGAMDLEGIPLRLTLHLLLRELGLDYYVKDGILIISARECFPPGLR